MPTTCGNAGGAGGAGGDGNVVWSNVTITPGCFLFSEPGSLGTASTWGGDGEAKTLTFDAVGRTYAGSLEGAMLTLQGNHEETFVREVWQYQETFSGAVAGGVFQGSWTYTECNFTLEPENCPANGSCEGHADFAITLPEGLEGGD